VEFDSPATKQLYPHQAHGPPAEERQDRQHAAGAEFAQSEIAGETWEAISGTEYKAKFDSWIRNKIGLTTRRSRRRCFCFRASRRVARQHARRARRVLARIVDLEPTRSCTVRWTTSAGRSRANSKASQPAFGHQGGERGRIRGVEPHRDRGGGARHERRSESIRSSRSNSLAPVGGHAEQD